MTTVLLAMDRASVRRRDANGFMHVEISNISKANICPYYGSEIPNWQALGLEADRVYQLYRHPEELAKAAETFNNVPLLSEHLPVVPHDLPEDLIIGSTGTNASFDGEYLSNSLVVWCGEHQEAIETRRQRELSCGYRYRADMTPGVTEEGLRYDGVMREIIGNHVALVIEGRAGPDVVVGDELMKLKSRTALMISGALQAHIRPLLAADAKVDIAPALAAADAASLAMDGAPKSLADKVAVIVKPHLASDKTLDNAALASIIGSITPLALDEDKIEEAEDEDDDDDKQAQDEDPDAEKDDIAEDEDGEEEDDDKPAMDSASVRKLISDAEKRGAKRTAAIEIAKADVKPHVGEVIGMDSAEAIYRFALDEAGVSTKGVHPSALKAMVAMLPKPGTEMAQDRKQPVIGGKLAQIVPNLPNMIRS
ncbi:hypothetical protein GCM10011349_19980 [Novosphingobium indicum]|uniref:DUF2213 domain-containing protein n=1 Tax=Novosphingobium indicum TaxID=462949 RepID=A0ABQ2JPZ4_9SPHN|nr:DUF2213 domain-containing protein [Novosphingobium indicum]GGN49387.1 hypothetical protein GCM10011349_19980 [Novosphingobium indicum]